MRVLAKPEDDPTASFLICISRVKDAALKTRLDSVVDTIQAGAQSYEMAVAASTLEQFPSSTDVAGVVTADEMVDVYTNRMAKKKAPGRPIYDRLMANAPHGRCPLCGQQSVSTLDHHLPKTRYPALAVNPVNLIPACSDCNKLKGETAPTTPGEQTLHPYFDNVEGNTWLEAEVLATSPPTLKFFVAPPQNWAALLSERVEFHFQFFKLGQVYASYAAEELVNIRHALLTINHAAGAEGVRDHLTMQAASMTLARRNSWQAAMYRALALSDFYFGGAFNDLDLEAL